MLPTRTVNFGAQILIIQMRLGAEKRGSQEKFASSIEKYEIWRRIISRSSKMKAQLFWYRFVNL